MSVAQAVGEYEYTNDWFEQNVPVWDVLIPQYEPQKFLEIGSYEGRSVCYLIEKFATKGPIEIDCIDTWAGGVEHGEIKMSDVERRFDKNIAIAQSKVPNAARVTKHKTFSHIAMAELIAAGRANSFDVVYIDGSHQAPDVLSDCVMGFHLLRVGGLMICDDYVWSMEPIGSQDSLNMPKPAIDAFLNMFQRKMIMVRGAPIYQVYAAKTGA
ncbi:MAG: class I SAM-dependent methyltransferase [Rhodospirillaceae bacterium]|nr:class I SAM-dependent methyltransferase [Rhodospirillaceae bacterium]